MNVLAIGAATAVIAKSLSIADACWAVGQGVEARRDVRTVFMHFVGMEITWN